MARGGVLDVPGHESRHPEAWRAMREHLEPEFRGPPGQGWPDAPGKPANGRRRRDCRTFCGYSRVGEVRTPLPGAVAWSRAERCQAQYNPELLFRSGSGPRGGADATF